ncbi:hypothetical protein [Streptomyces sp. AS02]|uniref:hypothetical protein n=1 Tax=Streptomyces sp. AS02 TaxID=2938946 RepID=UPI0020220497|nr:hypothetical protein [Streptomyces sp. AS02]MCL8010185.1 hypothetical protein [Streptomyces sp. AS02]
MGTLNKRKGTRRGRESDVEAVLDDLYVTPPTEFVARRAELAAAAKTAGHVEDARRIGAARRPTLAAWAANLLRRSSPEESRRILELGPALREAYHALDAGGIKELAEQRRHMVSALSRQAAQLARQAGHPLSATVQQDVESTLRAVLADPEAADRWAGGRLESALTPPSDFPTGTAAATPTPRRPTASTAPAPSARTRSKDELAERRRQRQEQLDEARKAAEEATRRLHDRRAEQADADDALQQARDQHDQARQQVSAAEQQLRQAREELQRAEHEQREAEERGRTTADALARAEREEREAAREVKRLSTRRR